MSTNARIRYYYTDALKAAYMAREFGFKIYHPENEEFQEENFSFSELISFVDDPFNHGAAAPYYIHPDSIPLLEPKEGDLIEWWNPRAFDSYNHRYSIMDKNPVHRDNKFIILLREGKAFFTPEQEDL